LSENKISTILIGNELLNGKIVDCNALFLARGLQTYQIGFDEVVIAPDRRAEIAEAVLRLSQKNSIIVCFGGLGPTSDDLTRYALADAAGVELKDSPEVKDKLVAFARKRGRELSPTNLRQAEFPAGARRIENSVGTADAFCMTMPSGCEVYALPGVPSEVRHLLTNGLIAEFAARLSGAGCTTHSYKVFGLSESLIGEKVESLTLPEEVGVAYRPQFPEILLEVSLPDSWSGEDSASTLRRVKQVIGEEYVFSQRPDEGLAEVVVSEILNRGEKLTIAESCTGGMISSELISVPGASGAIEAGIVSYSNRAKELFLGVPHFILEEHGAVSAPVVCAMARGARFRTGADRAVSVSGIAGPDGGTDEKPVGTVFIGYSDSEGEEAYEFNYINERNAWRRYITFRAIDLLRRKLFSL
jgi:nicotinamide-nucleotide amidase